jgi:hypothetical protein
MLESGTQAAFHARAFGQAEAMIWRLSEANKDWMAASAPRPSRDGRVFHVERSKPPRASLKPRGGRACCLAEYVVLVCALTASRTPSPYCSFISGALASGLPSGFVIVPESGAFSVIGLGCCCLSLESVSRSPDFGAIAPGAGTCGFLSINF